VASKLINEMFPAENITVLSGRGREEGWRGQYKRYQKRPSKILILFVFSKFTELVETLLYYSHQSGMGEKFFPPLLHSI